MKIELPIPPALRAAINAFPRCLIVGGSVRDHFLGLVPKDFDVEVYGMTPEKLQGTLATMGRVELVGESFGVFKLTTADGETHDFSMPRRDSKAPGEVGHRAFKIDFDPTISEVEAAARRDLTINALAWNPKTGDVLDFYGGVHDIESKTLRHTTAHFQDDPLRPLRIFQFAARFGFDVAPETAALCHAMAYQFPNLPKERVGEEFNKFLLKGKDHWAGLEVLSKMGWLSNFPELAALNDLPQDPEYHPEGHALRHTGLTVTALTRLPRWQALPHLDKLATGYGMLTHDLGKAVTTKLEFKAKLNRDVVVSPGHDKKGVPLCLEFLSGLAVPKIVQERAAALVSNHMEHIQIKDDTHIRRLAVSLGRETIYNLGMIVEGDMSGRPPLEPGQSPAMQHILDNAEKLNCLNGKQPAVLQGRDLVKLGVPPGKAMGVLLEAAYEAQIKGHITDMDSAQGWYTKNRGVILENAKLAPERLFSGEDLIAAAVPGGKLFGQIHRDIFDGQLNGTIRTRHEAVSFLRERAEVYHLPAISLDKLGAIADAAPATAPSKWNGKAK